MTRLRPALGVLSFVLALTCLGLSVLWMTREEVLEAILFAAIGLSLLGASVEWLRDEVGE